MVNQLELSKKINQTFAHYPGANKLYVTDDGEVFTDKVFADSHANCLPSTKVKIVERPQTTEAVGETGTKPDDAGSPKDTGSSENTGTPENTEGTDDAGTPEGTDDTSKEEQTTDKGKAPGKKGGNKK